MKNFLAFCSLQRVSMGKLEKWLFLGVALLNLLPLFSGKYFPTLDGAAHLYNANIIKELIVNPEGIFSNYFEFNHSLVPNWIGHFILALLLYFFPAFIAEKCLLILFLLGLPYVFRALVKKLNATNSLSSFLIFPFCYSSVFLLGFYNFSIAILMMFLIFNSWLSWEKKKISAKKIALFSLLFIVLYFSHLLVFVMTVCLLFGRALYLAFYNLLFQKELKNPFRNVFLTQFSFLLISALFPIILLTNYFLTRNAFSSSAQLSSEQLIQKLIDIESIIGFSYDFEKSYTFYLFCTLTILFLSILFKRLMLFVRQRILVQQNDYWIFAAFGVLGLYFLVPNEGGGAGFISIRLNLIFYLLIILWISTQQLNKKYLGGILLVILFINFNLTKFYLKATRDINKFANAITASVKILDDNSVLIPLNYTDRWFTVHFSNYLGVDKNIVVLDNYESTTLYFPLRWAGKLFPNIIMGKSQLGKKECITWLSNSNGVNTYSDYVLEIGEPNVDLCTIAVSKELSIGYTQIYSNNLVRLFKRNDSKGTP